ncbi:MAG: hypothetical protein P8130_06425 [Deltaproteobacteria bacterium]
MLHFRHASRFPKRSFCLTPRPSVTAFVIVVFVVLATVTGCGDDGDSYFSFRDPDVEPIKAVVRTTVPLAYAASVAMSSVTGYTPPNAAFVYNDCTTTPDSCAAVLRINDDDSSVPMQLSSSGPGTITVYGFWVSADMAILAVAFSDDAGSMFFPVHNISLFPVIKKGGTLIIVYTNIDVNVGTIKDPRSWTTLEINDALTKLNITASSDDPYANVSMDAWVIETNDGNTVDLSDDTYSISGAGQYMAASSGSASLFQLAMASVVIGPDCLLNPNVGFALLNEFKGFSSDVVVATALIFFRPSCDGNALVTVATGNYIESIGDLIPLNLNTP